MNEVKAVSVTVPLVARNASSDGMKGAKESDVKPLATGDSLPVKEATVVPKDELSQGIVSEKETSREKTQQAVSEVNQFIQSVQRDLHFSVDEDSGLTVIRVRDKESGELIRQIPEDIFLNLAQNLKDNKSIQLFDTHG